MVCRSLRFQVQTLFTAVPRRPLRRRKHQARPRLQIRSISVQPPGRKLPATSITTAIRTKALALGFIFVSAIGSLAAAQNLPVTPAETLAGQKISFPAALAGKPAVCVFGFSKEAGDRTKDWMTRLSRDGINAWSIAELEAAPSFIRGMIRSSMRKGTPEPMLEHSLIMTKDEQAWKRALGAKEEKLPVVVVLDANGKAVWTYEGLATDAAYQELKAKLGTR